MDRKEFARRLSDGTLPNTLLFEGEEDYLKQAALKDLRDALLPPGLEEMNETRMEAPETGALIAAAETLPFLADRRMILVRDHPALTGRAEGDEALIDYLPRTPPTALILFYCTVNPDGRKKLYTTIKKLGGIVTFSALRDRELTTFVTEAFRTQGKECDERTADFLIFTSGADTARLLTEVAKISAHAGENPSIRPEDISALATPSTECTIFQMVDAVVAGQGSRAFTLLRNQLMAGTDRIAMLAMLLRQYRLLQHIKIMQFEKRDNAFIRTSLGVPPFAVEQYLRQAAQYTGGQVKRAVQICFDTDYAIKSGRLNQEGALEAAVLKLLNLKQK